jgi:hypothetical protein
MFKRYIFWLREFLNRSPAYKRNSALWYMTTNYNKRCKESGLKYYPKVIIVGPELYSKILSELYILERRYKCEGGITLQFKACSLYLDPHMKGWDYSMGVAGET